MAHLTRNKVRDSAILRLPGARGKEPELDAIRAVENAHAPAIDNELQEILQYVLAGAVATAMLSRVDALPTTGLTVAVNSLLKAGGNAGVAMTARIMVDRGVAIPVTYAENIVAQWANRYDYHLIRGINNHSREFMRKHVSAWAQSNDGLPVLRDRLSPMFGAGRAQLIASTEATRAYTEGTFTAWESAGFARRPPEKDRPPAHPRCRCWPAMAEGENTPGYYVYVWYTAVDDRVCEICWPKHATVIGQAGRGNG